MATITLAAIDSKIGTFTTNRKALASLGHEIAMMIFMHAAPKEVSSDCNGTGDCTRALPLMQQLPKSWAAQMDNWLRLYTPIRVVVRNNKCEYDPAYKKLTAEEKLTWWKIEEANLNPFYELNKPDLEEKLLTFEELLKMVESMAKRIETRVKDNDVADEDKESALAMAATLRKVKFDRVKADNANEAGDEANAAAA